MISEKGEEEEKKEKFTSIKLHDASRNSEDFSKIIELEGKSLNYFESANPLRRRLFDIATENRFFNWFIMATILASAV